MPEVRPCMTPEEAALWATPTAYKEPGGVCFDCTMAFHLEQRALGLCDSEPGQRATPPKREPRPMGRPRVAAEGPERERLRAQWRAQMARRTARRMVEKTLAFGVR